MIRYLSLMLVVVLSLMVQGVPAQSAADSSQPFFIDVSDGQSHTCAIEADGALTCTQASHAYRVAPPDNLPAMSDVEVGDVHACGLTQSGTAACWGDNDFGQLDVPEATQFQAIGAGVSHSCGITLNGSVACWGLNDVNQSTVPEDVLINAESQEAVSFIDLELAERHSCGLDEQGRIHCWGDVPQTYLSASLADEDTGASVVKFAVDKFEPLYYQCGLLSDGSIDCVDDRYRFFQQYVDIAGSGGLICGLSVSGDLDCHGNASVLFENSDLYSQVNAINRAGTLVSISGNYRLCGVSDRGSISCVNLSSYNHAVPGDPQTVYIAPVNLSARVYSDTTVELFWGAFTRSEWELAYVEIHRDDELLVQTQGESHVDNTLQPGRDYRYRIRYVPVVGTPSEFTAAITVNTDSLGGEGSQREEYVPPERPLQAMNLQALVYGSELLELIWDGSADSSVGYEVRRNGEYIGHVLGNSYLDRSVSSGNDYVYEVITVTAEQSMVGVAMTRVAID